MINSEEGGNNSSGQGNEGGFLNSLKRLVGLSGPTVTSSAGPVGEQLKTSNSPTVTPPEQQPQQPAVSEQKEPVLTTAGGPSTSTT